MKTEDISLQANKGKEVQSAEEVEESLRLIEDLKFFLATAPANWQENQVIRRYYLSNDEGFVSCVFWNNLYYITGTDIVRCCAYRMQRFGREIVERKKFEEGIFSDLRNLKCGIDATLEKPKSEFLAFLYKNMCLKTQKKQKVFFWFSVPHDRLFADALERDLKREASEVSTTTKPLSEPALSFRWESSSEVSLYDQITHHVESQRTDSGPSTAAPRSGYVETPISAMRECSPLDEEVDLTEESKDSIELPSSEVEANYETQQLVIPRPDDDGCPNSPTQFDQINTGLKPSDILASTQEENDFPLDYFPVEIEYPHTSIDTSFHMGPPSGKLPNQMFVYDDMDNIVPPSKYPMPGGTYEDPYFRDEFSSASRHPMTAPMSATRSQYMTNAEYYSMTKDGKKGLRSSNCKQPKVVGKKTEEEEPIERDNDSPLEVKDYSESSNDGQSFDYVEQGFMQGGDSDDQYPFYHNRRIPINEAMIHPYTGMLLNPYMFYNMLSVDPTLTMGSNLMMDSFYGQPYNMDTMVHDMYPPQETTVPTNYRSTPKAAFFNIRSPYGRNFPPPSAMNPYYTPYQRRQASPASRMGLNKSTVINRKPKSPSAKNIVNKPSQKPQKTEKMKLEESLKHYLGEPDSKNDTSNHHDEIDDNSNSSI